MKTQCPVCHNDSLEYRLQATVRCKVRNGILMPMVSYTEVDFSDDAETAILKCVECGEDNRSSGAIDEIKADYDNDRLVECIGR